MGSLLFFVGFVAVCSALYVGRKKMHVVAQVCSFPLWMMGFVFVEVGKGLWHAVSKLDRAADARVAAQRRVSVVEAAPPPKPVEPVVVERVVVVSGSEATPVPQAAKVEDVRPMSEGIQWDDRSNN